MIPTAHGLQGPGGIPFFSSALLFHFPKAAWASLHLSHLNILLSIKVYAAFCVASKYTSLLPLSDFVLACTLALLLTADKNAMLKVLRFKAGEQKRADFLSILLPESRLRCSAELVKDRFPFQINISIWINLQQS